MNLATRKKQLRQGELWCSLEISGPGFVIVLFTLLVMMMIYTPTHPPGVSVDLAETPHAVKLPGAVREDALVLAVMRDGTYYVGRYKVSSDQIAFRLSEGIAAGSERKVYINADGRAKYGAVEAAIDAVQDAGIEQIGLVTMRPRERGKP